MRIPDRRPRRRALATLELALALPFLVFMAAAIFKVAEACLSKTDTAVHARRDGWKGRDEALEKETAPLPDETLFHAALQLDGKPGQGVTDEKKTHTIHLPPVAHGSADVGTRLVVLQGTWDHRSIDFPDRAPMAADSRVWSVIAVGALPPGATQVDVNAFDLSGKPFLGQLDASKFGFQSLTSDNGSMANTMLQFAKAANPSIAQGEQIANAVKNPAKAGKDLLGTVTNLDKFSDAIGKLGAAPDSLGQVGGMLGDLSKGMGALQDLGVDGSNFRQIKDVADTVGSISDKVGDVAKGLKTTTKVLERLKKNPADDLKDIIKP